METEFEGFMKGIPEESLLYQPSLVLPEYLNLKSTYQVPKGKKLYVFSSFITSTKSSSGISGESNIVITDKFLNDLKFVSRVLFSSSEPQYSIKEDTFNAPTSPYVLFEGQYLQFYNSGNVINVQWYASAIEVDKGIDFKF